MEYVSADKFLRIGNTITKTKRTQNESTQTRRFKSFFGVTPYVCLIVWNKIRGKGAMGFEPKHLLWTLVFFKQYTVEGNRHAILNSDEKTIRKYVWYLSKLLSEMDVIFWENRKNGSVPGQTAFCSLDGVDCQIKEPIPFSPRWFSHKFRGPGLRYEIGLCIRSGHIVWVHGGYPCGEYSDLKLAREAYVLSVDAGEKTLADKIYRDPNFFILPNRLNGKVHTRIMSRHETVNKRLKHFQILKQPFRHDLKKHPQVFKAVANLTQLMILNGEPLFKV